MASFKIQTQKPVCIDTAAAPYVLDVRDSYYVFTDGYSSACLAWAAGKSYYEAWRTDDGSNTTVIWKSFLEDISKVTDMQIHNQAQKCEKDKPYNITATENGWVGVLASKRTYLRAIIDAGITKIEEVDI
jgi:hypothetical protein